MFNYEVRQFNPVQEDAIKALITRGHIYETDDGVRWSFDSPQFVGDGHALRVLFLQANGYFTHIDAVSFQIEMSSEDPNELLPPPWQVEVNLWVETYKNLVRGEVDIIDAYSILNRNRISQYRR